MQFIKTDLPDAVIIEPRVWSDSRGYFFESFSNELFHREIGSINFVQDNESKSSYGILRGLHLQKPPYTQAKLVRVITGEVLDVIVDVRTDSPAFGKHLTINLSEENKRQLFVPRGFAHGFIVLSKEAIFSYKVDNIYSIESELGIIYNDIILNIDWKLKSNNIQLSNKDASLPRFNENTFYTKNDYTKNI